jgi:hypothetical protein
MLIKVEKSTDTKPSYIYRMCGVIGTPVLEVLIQYLFKFIDALLKTVPISVSKTTWGGFTQSREPVLLPPTRLQSPHTLQLIVSMIQCNVGLQQLFVKIVFDESEPMHSFLMSTTSQYQFDSHRPTDWIFELRPLINLFNLC